MRRCRPRLLCRALLWLCVALPGAARAAPADAAGATQEVLQALQALHLSPAGDGLDAAQAAADAPRLARLDALFDFAEIAQQAIAPHRRRLSAAQLRRFLQAFPARVRTLSFSRAAAFLRRAEVEVGAPQPAGPRTRVAIQARVPEEDLETQISFVWQARGGGLRVVDVDFDGVSFVKDYQNQFGRILQKAGPEALLERLGPRRQAAPSP